MQGVDTVNRIEKVRINSRTDTLLKTVNYYEFVAVINQIRAKVIVKQIENGEPFFLEHNSKLENIRHKKNSL